MDFKLTASQEALAAGARDFLKQHLKPISARLDEDGKIPIDFLQRAAEKKYLGITIPAGYGGMEANYQDAALVAFEIGRTPAVEAGFRVVGAHTDSPNLRIKPAADVSAHGYLRLTTPKIDTFLEHRGGFVFDRTTAVNPSCHPSHTTILSGLYPQQTGVPWCGEDLLVSHAEMDEEEEVEELEDFQEEFQVMRSQVRVGSQLQEEG